MNANGVLEIVDGRQLGAWGLEWSIPSVVRVGLSLAASKYAWQTNPSIVLIITH